MVEVSASILNIDNEKVIKTLYDLEMAGINYFHIDVMDGKFVKNNTTERMLEYCEYINSISNLPLDVHLMVEDVEEYIKSFSVFDPNIITFHIEAVKGKEQILRLINLIKEYNIKVGISVKPNTSIEEIYEYLPYIHMALIMTVEPGKGGQNLLPETIEKIKKIKEYSDKENLDIDIEVDGGINEENVGILKEAGANIIVSGSAIIKAKDFKEVVSNFKKY